MSRANSLPGLEKATVIPREEHGISRKDISEAALRVVYGLQNAGFAAFLVGGCVRDLLLGLHPKDFDVATDAHPEDVRRVFRRSRIIGRRFRIVHVRFGREIIEVTTFRGHHEQENRLREAPTREQSRQLDSAHSHTGMTLIDNVYGNIDEDAARRDFTVNALYYTTDGFKLLDFHNGLADLRERRLRVIGDAAGRYREDPVRMLRAVRFAAKLGFTLDSASEQPLRELGELVESASSARLFDELLKLLCGGHAEETFRLLRTYGLDQVLFCHQYADPAPAAEEAMTEAPEQKQAPAEKLVPLALRNSDRRIAEGLRVTPGFLLAALLWPPLRQRLQALDGPPNLMQLRERGEQTVLEQSQLTTIPRRISLVAQEIWELQLRLERRDRRSLRYCFDHHRFRAGYDFLLLREESGEDTGGMGQWWTSFQQVDEAEQTRMLEQMSARPRRRRRRGGRGGR